jgi:hypothetical protein
MVLNDLTQDHTFLIPHQIQIYTIEKKTKATKQATNI